MINLDEIIRKAQEAERFGQYADAVQIYFDATSKVRSPVLFYNLCLLEIRLGNLEGAVQYCREVISIAPHALEARQTLASLLLDLGQPVEAGEYLAALVSINPLNAIARSDLALAFVRQKRGNDAYAQVRMALSLASQSALVNKKCSRVLNELNYLAEAIEAAQKALLLAPSDGWAAVYLCAMLEETGAFDEAIEIGHLGTQLMPDHFAGWLNFGRALASARHFERAIDAFSRAIELAPNEPQPRVGRALALLTLGNLAAAWPDYEWRRRLATFREPLPVGVCEWDGGSLKGKTILLVTEQGFGDAIQFVRYVTRVAELGAHVVLACPDELSSLFSSVHGVSRVVPHHGAFPRVDTFAYLMSVPRLVGERLETIQAPVPYLVASSDRRGAWSGRLGRWRRPRVGLVWAGSQRAHVPGHRAVDQRRSLRLRELQPVLAVAGIDFVSLQMGPQVGEISGCGQEIADYSTYIHDFNDTAALVSSLDLVISVDTAVVHLAGALGKSVWILSRFDSCWRWFTGRDDSPWYPTARVFRQNAPGDWREPLTQVVNALGAWRDTISSQRTGTMCATSSDNVPPVIG